LVVGRAWSENFTDLAPFVMARLDRTVPLYSSLLPMERQARAMTVQSRDFRPLVSLRAERSNLRVTTHGDCCAALAMTGGRNDRWAQRGGCKARRPYRPLFATART
jgi:hypothetical protein